MTPAHMTCECKHPSGRGPWRRGFRTLKTPSAMTTRGETRTLEHGLHAADKEALGPGAGLEPDGRAARAQHIWFPTWSSRVLFHTLLVLVLYSLLLDRCVCIQTDQHMDCILSINKNSTRCCTYTKKLLLREGLKNQLPAPESDRHCRDTLRIVSSYPSMASLASFMRACTADCCRTRLNRSCCCCWIRRPGSPCIRCRACRLRPETAL